MTTSPRCPASDDQTYCGITRTQASSVLRIFIDLDPWSDPGYGAPQLRLYCRDHAESAVWQIVWPNGPQDWTLYAPPMPRPIVAKPYSMGALSLYHEDSDAIHLVGM